MYRIVSEDLPRLLVFSQAIPESRYAGSLLLLRLLKSYPPESILVIGPRPHPESAILRCRYELLRDVPLARLYRTRLSRLKRSLDAFGFGGKISDHDAETMAQAFRPDVVVTVMQESQFYRAAASFCERNSVPLVLVIHDLVELFEPVLPWAINRRRQRNAEVVRSAAVRFCISPAMVDRLRKDYGVDSTVLYPNRSEELTPRPPAMSEALRNDGHLTIGYAGSLSYGYGEAVQAILPALKSADAVLRVYSPAAPAGLGEYLEYAGFLPAPMQTWERIKNECDAVLLPYAWPEQFRALYETHFPSKLTEYLGLGMPVLISGPAYAAGVAWGLRHPLAALTVSDPSEEAMRAACVRLRNDAALRMSLASEGVHAGNEEFGPIGIRNQFLRQLRNVAVSPNRVSPTLGIKID